MLAARLGVALEALAATPGIVLEATAALGGALEALAATPGIVLEAAAMLGGALMKVLTATPELALEPLAARHSWSLCGAWRICCRSNRY